MMNDEFRDMMPTSQEFYGVSNGVEPTNDNGLTASEQAEHERDYNAYLEEMERSYDLRVL